jgi:hypothetical protein
MFTIQIKRKALRNIEKLECTRKNTIKETLLLLKDVLVSVKAGDVKSRSVKSSYMNYLFPFECFAGSAVFFRCFLSIFFALIFSLCSSLPAAFSFWLLVTPLTSAPWHHHAIKTFPLALCTCAKKTQCCRQHQGS